MLDVMLVDDSSTIRAAIGMMLTHAGHRVQDAASGESSLAALEDAAKRPDVFIVDLNMPGMNGIEFLRKLRSMPRHRFTPVVFLTTEGGGEPRKMAKAAGASGWIVKPVAAPDLMRVLHHVCAKAT
jgi:two-component system chemotaxis response regulator CheY